MKILHIQKAFCSRWKRANAEVEREAEYQISFFVRRKKQKSCYPLGVSTTLLSTRLWFHSSERSNTGIPVQGCTEH